MKINFQALGCRLNEAELESWISQFNNEGHQLTMDSRDADLVVFNSCSVTAEADRKSRKLINRIHKSNPHSRLVVTGCYASLHPQQVASQLGVDLVVDNQNKEQLVDRVIEHFELPSQSQDSPAMDEHSLFARGRHRAFIKVQDGCRYRCTFCIVTVARGKERSRPAGDIVAEINRHHQQGVQEVAITGVHVGGYGSDLGTNLYQLLSEILDNTRIPRIRLASVEPWDLPDNFFTLFRDPRLMPHMHLPLQSGSDSVLRRMARRCKTAQFAELVDRARRSVTDFNITTDLIVGFPGETEDDWERSLRFVESTGFGHMHIFTYSARAGTKAATMPDQVPDAVKKQRSQEMHALADRLKVAEMQSLVGAEVAVLSESAVDAPLTRISGYTPQYHRIVSTPFAPRQSGIYTVRVSGVDADKKCLLGETQA